MKNWRQLALMIIIIASVIIGVLLIILGGQKIAQQQALKKQATAQAEQVSEQEKADVLLEQVDDLRNLTQSFVIPQVKLNIRL